MSSDNKSKSHNRNDPELENSAENTKSSKSDSHKEEPQTQQPMRPDDLQADENQLDAALAQIAELTNALQRERADAVNMRRRHEEQIAALKNVVKARVIQDLLPVIDNFERALKHVPKNLEGNDFVKGVKGVVKQFEKTLADIGVERIKTVGEPFDPEFHEAVSMEEGEGTHEMVSEELQSGYKLGDDVIRHAMVKVKMA